MFHGGIAVPGRPFANTSKTFSGLGFLRWKLVGCGARAPATGPFPSPLAPWQLAQLAAKRDSASFRLVAACVDGAEPGTCKLWMNATRARKSSVGSWRQGGIEDPATPFHSTLLNRSSENRAAVRFAGFGIRLAEALPSPAPPGP